MIKKIEKKIAGRVFVNKRTIFIIGVILLVIAVIVPRFGSQVDETTARAVASLLARAAISETDLNAAMDIPGVSDVYVTNGDGRVVLPARRSGTIEVDHGEAVASFPVGDNHSVVVFAREQLSPPVSPIILFLLLVIGGWLLVLRWRKKENVAHTSADSGAQGAQVGDGISLDLASMAAGAALITLDHGCRVVSASQLAKDEFGVTSQGSHLMDMLDPHEVQSMLQLIRRSDRGDVVSDDLCWKGEHARACVMKDGKGFLVKLKRRCRGE